VGLPKKVIFVYSGKGGVGKSTVATNLTFALMQLGHSVGLFDADLYGPSVPLMVAGLSATMPTMEGHRVQPGHFGAVRVGSIGFIGEETSGHVWVGDYLTGVLHQLLFDVDWDSDILVIDLPPGSGEVHHRIAYAISGKALLVTTPQDVSFADTRRGADMLHRLQTPIIGVVENMAANVCPACGLPQPVFAGDTLERLCRPLNLSLLASLPLLPSLSEQGNRGIPYVIQYPDLPLSQQFRNLAGSALAQCERTVVNWPAL